MLDKLKQLTKDTAIYGISTMVGRFLNFLLVPFFTNIFLPDVYNVQSQIYVFMSIMNIIMVYGMDSSYLKFATNSPVEEKKKNFTTSFAAIVSVSLLFALLVFGLRNSILDLLAVPVQYSHFFYYVVFILFFDSCSVVPFLKLRIERKAKTFAFLKVLNIFINIFLNIILILKYHLGIEAIFISNLAASFITFLLFIPVIIKNLEFSLDNSLFIKFLKFGLPYLPAGLASMLVQGIDRPILTRLTNNETAGIYNANYKLGIFMMLFVNMFQFAWQPFFLQNAGETNARETFSKVMTYFTLIGSVILVVLSLFISDLIRIDFGGKYLIGPLYWSGVIIVPVILLGYLFNGIYFILSAGIYIKEKSLYAPLVTGIGAAVNIIVNFALIPSMGIMGAAIATLASYFAMSIGYYIITQRIYKTDYEYDKLIKLALGILAVGGIYYYHTGEISVAVKGLMLVLFLLYILFFVLDKHEMIFLKSIKWFKNGKD